ncbi:hypothetical protein ACF1BA_34350 [Streptomyces rubiginosohelvolus]|uniref:hypothetical protein n=1 Tax=Streptomyces rubiginosohelvolus TaxID=67362 RepID=UPI0036F9F3D1
MAVTLPLSGCVATVDSAGSGEGKERATAAIEAARAYQQAQLDQDWEAACEAMTERLRRSQGMDTMAECVEVITAPKPRDNSDARVRTSEVIEVPALGPHPAGIGVGVGVIVDSRRPPLVVQTALRLVPDERGTWLVDQMANIFESEIADSKAVRAELAERVTVDE